MLLTSLSNVHADGCLRTNRYDEGNNRTFWAILGDRIVNVINPDEVLDVKGNDTSDGAEVCAWRAHGGANQQWNFVYI